MFIPSIAPQKSIAASDSEFREIGQFNVAWAIHAAQGKSNAGSGQYRTGSLGDLLHDTLQSNLSDAGIGLTCEFTDRLIDNILSDPASRDGLQVSIDLYRALDLVARAWQGILSSSRQRQIALIVLNSCDEVSRRIVALRNARLAMPSTSAAWQTTGLPTARPLTA